MPYVECGRQAELRTEPERARTAGDYNFLYTQEYLKAFIANPSYFTIALIRKSSGAPWDDVIPGVAAIDNLLCKLNVSVMDRGIARELAFMEFYRRVGVAYETLAMHKNGDLELYERALTACAEKFNPAGVK